jgi:membrane protease YdiL (CAAX protease family)
LPTLSDFLLVLALGVAAAVVAGLAVGPDLTPFLVFAVILPAQYAGHIAGIAWVLRQRHLTMSDLGFEITGSDPAYLLLGMVLQFALAILVLPLIQLVGLPVVESPQEIQSLIVGDLTTPARVALMLSTALLAPVVEELMFRGMLLQTTLARWGRRPALLITSLAFAALHLVTLDPSQFLAAAVITLPRFFIMGLVVARLTLRKGRLGPAIFTHAGFNLIGVIALFVTAGG